MMSRGRRAKEEREQPSPLSLGDIYRGPDPRPTDSCLSALSVGDLDLDYLAELDVKMSVKPTSVVQEKAPPPPRPEETRGRKSITWRDEPSLAMSGPIARRKMKASLWELYQSTSPPDHGQFDRLSELTQSGFSSGGKKSMKKSLAKSVTLTASMMMLSGVMVFSEQDKLLHQNQHEMSTRDLSKSNNESDGRGCAEAAVLEVSVPAGHESDIRDAVILPHGGPPPLCLLCNRT